MHLSRCKLTCHGGGSFPPPTPTPTTPPTPVVHEWTPTNVEQMYGILGVSMPQPEERVARVTAQHGCPPCCSFGFGRRGF